MLSYTLGLRHALDADVRPLPPSLPLINPPRPHPNPQLTPAPYLPPPQQHISAIDLTTRRLIASGQRPVAVGTFFSLGHSTVVIVTCIVVAATAGALRERFDDFQRVGGIIGTSVSAAFLLLLCLGNGWVLARLVKRVRVVVEEQRLNPGGGVGVGGGGGAEVVEEGGAASQGMLIEGAGFMATVFRKVFRMVDRPWKMLPLGVLFGLGFDTSSEIAILGIASIQAAQGTSMWVILIFPVLFTGEFSLSFLVWGGGRTD